MDFWATEVANLNFLEALVKLLTRTALLAILVWILEFWLRSRPARIRQALGLFFLATLLLWPLLVAIAPSLPLPIGTYTRQGYRGVPCRLIRFSRYGNWKVHNASKRTAHSPGARCSSLHIG